MNPGLDKEKVYALVEKLTLEVLQELEPSSIDLSAGMIAPLFAEVLRGQIVAVNNNEHAGGWGGADLLVYTVVPLISQGLANGEGVVTLERADVRGVVRQTHSHRARNRLDDLTSTVNIILKRHAQCQSGP